MKSVRLDAYRCQRSKIKGFDEDIERILLSVRDVTFRGGGAFSIIQSFSLIEVNRCLFHMQ